MAEETSIVGLPRFNNQAMALAPAAAGAGADTGLTTETSAADTMVAIFKDMRASLDQLVTFASKQIKPIISIPSNLTTINTSIKSSEVGGTAEEKKDKEPGMLSSLRQIIGEKFVGNKGMGAVDASDGSLSKGLMKAPDALAKFMAGFGANPGMVKSKAGDSYAADSSQGKVIVQAEKDRKRKENLADSEGNKDEPKKQGMIGSLKDSFTSEAIGDDSKMMSKLIKVGILGAMALLLKFSEEFESAIAFVLEKGKKVFEMLGPNGPMILGLTALAAFIMPNTLMMLVTGIGKGTIKFALTLMKGAFFLLQAFMSGEFIKKLAGTYIGQGILRAFAAMKAAFALMQVFLFTTVPNKIAGSYIGQGILKAFKAVKAAFLAMQVFLFTDLPAKIASSYIGVGIARAITALKAAFVAMQVFLLTDLPAKIASSYIGVGIAKAITALKAAFVAMQVFLLTDLPAKIASSYIGVGIARAITALKAAFVAMQVFLLTTLPTKIASSYVGIGITKAITALKAAFVAMQVFLASTMVPAITTMMAPFIVPLALVVAAVLAAVAIFTSIKAGIDEFKQSLADGDSMLEAIISGVATALLTLVTLPITLIKNFVAWVAEKLGFEGIAKKLREFSFVDAIKNGITNLVTKIKDFVVGLMGFDKIKSFFAKIGSIGGMIMDFVKAITAGAAAAIWPGLKPFGNGPEFEYKKAFDASMAGSEAKRIEKADAKFKLAELAEVEAENQKVKKQEGKMNFYTTTTTNKAGDTINSNAVTLSNLSANHTEPTQMQLNMASR